ncbi:MAG: barstar family protein [Acidobacteria bacterium]|nr:barstar family protein [Acidobacteriota bacterium]
MAFFSADEETGQRRDFAILRDGGVALYWRPEALRMDLNWLESNEYSIAEFDAGKWKNEEQMHDALRSALSFPYYYGKNLDALNDCLSGIEVSEAGGTALVFHRYDQFANVGFSKDPDNKALAKIVLHIFADAVRYHMLFGRRLLILVQSDDPRISFEDLAGVSARWNPREWLNKDRELA